MTIVRARIRGQRDARTDYASWYGVTPVDKARENARLLIGVSLRAYWDAYADEVERLQSDPSHVGNT